MTVHLPDELRARVAAEAARQGKSVDALVAEIVAAQVPAEMSEDPLEAFIGSGSSGRGDLARRHREIRAEMTDGLGARDL
jgi:plasmid stability protein